MVYNEDYVIINKQGVTYYKERGNRDFLAFLESYPKKIIDIIEDIIIIEHAS